ncbi:transmembrane protein 45B-like [Selaginella moellendorffii]|uniref:transmembrane protein 45B-like n=1 Tax=Selaginella moellendorffii TaxID=88036 RepID=UPI000D1C22CF|nr:transmembrane protein 45B-like [Selaginella moellendorffii]|eukprot:XP_024530847.1 transmembrane protein 45B-like [Selaginella moellendorffii]
MGWEGMGARRSMFLVYSLAAILKEKTRILPLPKEILRLLAVTAFGLEFFLFYLKEDDGSGVQGQYHRLLLVPIGVCLLSTLLRICYTRSELLRFIQSLGLILQGAWFFQMASSIFSSRGMSAGWIETARATTQFTAKG